MRKEIVKKLVMVGLCVSMCLSCGLTVRESNAQDCLFLAVAGAITASGVVCFLLGETYSEERTRKVEEERLVLETRKKNIMLIDIRDLKNERIELIAEVEKYKNKNLACLQKVEAIKKDISEIQEKYF
ncbi:hypothetical protein [Candidatus Endomicrobiellum devescovinae]|jgi:hypothetical protein|uniref:hypothetical protein n=1 Tax=Candidatus Endomicrobiellum devescovinae TaxID=3242322 RepID=UPI002823BADF|nr:hypothetical protein [Endomicrobium sp.]